MRSRLTLPKIVIAASAARFASSASWTRPSAASLAASKLWTPSDSRLTPAAKKPANFARSKVPGLASSVISASGASGSRARMPASSRSIDAAENRLGVPPPKNTVPTLRPHTDGSENSRSASSASTYASSGSVAARLVRVEVAVRALADAPGQVHVQRQRRQRGEARRARRQGRRRHGAPPVSSASRAISARIAWPRCERRFLVSSGSSAAVRPDVGVEEMRVVAEAAGAARRVDDRRRASGLR